MTLLAYFDESGTHASSKSIAIGGFVGPDKRWNRFEREWRQELQSEGVPYMHMSELESRRRLFASWDKTRARNFQVRLLAIIRAHCAAGLSCALVLEDYRCLITEDPDKELPKKVGTPWGVCAAGCIACTVEWARKKHPGESVDFIFESGVRQGELTDWFGRGKRTTPELGSLYFRDKKDTLALQAADIHAYEAWKHAENQYVGGTPARDIRKSLEALFDMPLDGRHWDADGLRKRIDAVRHATEY